MYADDLLLFSSTCSGFDLRRMLRTVYNTVTFNTAVFFSDTGIPRIPSKKP